MLENFINYFKDDYATGGSLKQFNYMKIPFEKYEVTVMLDERQKFIGISEVKVNKEFLESYHKTASVYSLSDYYED